MKDSLKSTAKVASEAPDFKLLQLNAQLMQLYPNLGSNIESQADFGMLAYLKSMTRRGLTIHVDKYLDELALLPKYKPFILPKPDSVEIYDSDEDDCLSGDDSWYYPPPARILLSPTPPVSPEVRPTKRIMTRRTGPHHVDLPSDAPSSEESPSSQDATTSQEPALSQEFASPRRVVKEVVESDGPSQALERWVTKYNKNRDENTSSGCLWMNKMRWRRWREIF
jgi:hypothetical protein